ncbi:MAG: hypothetical protein JW861_08630 [Bacteroidales bacterium]|nr:hypothetical protein [Bacteroidales bacterium]
MQKYILLQQGVPVCGRSDIFMDMRLFAVFGFWVELVFHSMTCTVIDIRVIPEEEVHVKYIDSLIVGEQGVSGL